MRLDGRLVTNLISPQLSKSGNTYYSTPYGIYGVPVRKQDLPKGINTKVEINGKAIQLELNGAVARGTVDLGNLLGAPTMGQWYIKDLGTHYQVRLTVRRKGGNAIVRSLDFA